MASYRIHRIKDEPGESFRWTAHTGGLTVVRAKDYRTDDEIEAATPYAAWKSSVSAGRPLRPGDLLENLIPEANSGHLLIAKYIGFEPAAWWTPEAKPPCEFAPVTATPSNAAQTLASGKQD